MATDVVQEQCEAEGDTSVQQRLMMGAASTIQGTGGALCEEGEGNQDMMIAGGVSTSTPLPAACLHAYTVDAVHM